MKNKAILYLLLAVLVGLAFIFVGIFVPGTEIVKIILIFLGIITIITNILNIVSTRGKIVFELIISIIGISLGTLMIIFPRDFLSIIIALYLIVMPLLNILYFKKFVTEQDIIKLVFGVLFLLFSPFMFGIANAIVSIFLIVIGIIIFIGAIVGIILVVRYKKFVSGVTNATKNVTQKDVDFDFSNKK